ncbi:glutaredoxin family protein [Porticoccaceae bacterium LTM1]|nr:glutaredoxin family protein [Porticoccaceae bacterium LTM1]
MNLILYSGPHCTLCEKAKQVIWPVIAATGHQLQEVDITTDVELLRRYRLSIPVLAQEAGDELFWPFDSEQLVTWLETN